MLGSDLESVPVLLGENHSLFGVRTAPRENVESCGVIILNAGLLHHVGPFRLHVDIANHLGEQGFPVIRLDQSGKGESPRRSGRSRQESLLMDYDDAFESLKSLGVSSTVLIGLCSGADDGLYIASQRDSTAGLILLDGYAYKNGKFRLIHYAGRLFKIGPWIRTLRRLTESREYIPEIDIREWDDDDEMLRRFALILDRGASLLTVFTAGQNYYNHLGQLAAGLPNSCDTSGLQEVYFDKVDHTYNVTYHRRRLLETITEWMNEKFRK